MCNCIEKINKELESANIRVEVIIYFNGESSRIAIPTHKNNGKPAKITLQPNYCCICGEKY